MLIDSPDRLDVDYVNLLLLHWRHPGVDAAESFPAAAELRNDGLVKHTDVSNDTWGQLERTREAVAVPLVYDQVLYLPYNDQLELLEYCQRYDIALTAYRPRSRLRPRRHPRRVRGPLRQDGGPCRAPLAHLSKEHVVAIPKAPSCKDLAANAAIFDVERIAEKMRQVADAAPGLSTRLYNIGPAVMRMKPF